MLIDSKAASSLVFQFKDRPPISTGDEVQKQDESRCGDRGFMAE